jgi:plasmid maintenance system antidote protein VapI/deoxycytidine triphosphate deaminase
MAASPKSPGIVLQEEIAHAGLTQRDFAIKIDVTAPYLSMLISGARPFTETICDKLGKHTRVKTEDWQAMAQAESKAKAKAPKRGQNAKETGQGGGVLSEANLRREIALGTLQITPPVNEDNIDGGCLLLRPGTSVTIITPDGRRSVRTEQAELKPGDLLLMESLESLILPPHLYAQVEGLGEMIQEGLQLLSSSLSPNHKGKVSIVIKHLGFTPWELSTLPVARLRFSRVG